MAKEKNYQVTFMYSYEVTSEDEQGAEDKALFFFVSNKISQFSQSFFIILAMFIYKIP